MKLLTTLISLAIVLNMGTTVVMKNCMQSSCSISSEKLCCCSKTQSTEKNSCCSTKMECNSSTFDGFYLNTTEIQLSGKELGLIPVDFNLQEYQLEYPFNYKDNQKHRKKLDYHINLPLLI